MHNLYYEKLLLSIWKKKNSCRILFFRMFVWSNTKILIWKHWNTDASSLTRHPWLDKDWQWRRVIVPLFNEIRIKCYHHTSKQNNKISQGSFSFIYVTTIHNINYFIIKSIDSALTVMRIAGRRLIYSLRMCKYKR